LGTAIAQFHENNETDICKEAGEEELEKKGKGTKERMRD